MPKFLPAAHVGFGYIYRRDTLTGISEEDTCLPSHGLLEGM